MKTTLCVFVFILLLQSCSLPKKKAIRPRAAPGIDETPGATAEIDRYEAATQTVKESYDTAGHIKIRTTTVVRSKSSKQTHAEAARDKSKGTANQKNTKSIGVEEKAVSDLSVHKDVKRQGLPLWSWFVVGGVSTFVLWRAVDKKAFSNIF